MMHQKKTKSSTSWGKVAAWYGEAVEKEGSYQKELILPNLLRLLGGVKDTHILDLGCGSGFFTRECAKVGAQVTGVDISTELIALALRNSEGLAKSHAPVANAQRIVYHVSPAHKLPFLKDKSVDVILIVLTIQNIENVADVFKECARVLKQGGKMLIVMNHPVFRVPQTSSWGWDEETKVQYRRIDSYLSESKTEIKMNPSDPKSKTTISFHRPLQFYFKALEKAGFAVSRLEEWTSHKKSDPGPRAAAENRARKEMPLFLLLEAKL